MIRDSHGTSASRLLVRRQLTNLGEPIQGGVFRVRVKMNKHGASLLGSF